ncbi:ketosteroid isomerase [Mycobacterium sp. PS03-16]|uniref:ester cyclase n=1 Tax=Mycobacterium sp. PS03-16 TaxID=2559611 RepID=UPI001073538A|nr:ester cyclase [Mycobacterium sp. PS03-16]TFV58396.1 ketosteroid isomerase [Mycobacterium sp. PS03-16]
MPLTREQMDRMLDEHFAYEANDDVEGVLATLTPDVRHDIVGYPPGPGLGPEAARQFYEGLFDDLADSSVETVRRLYGENFMVDESVWRGRAPGRPFGLEGRNRPLQFRLLHILEFADDGRISRENVWLDLAAIQQQLTPGECDDVALPT